MKKKGFTIAAAMMLAAALLVSLAACGTANTNSSKADSQVESVEITASSPQQSQAVISNQANVTSSGAIDAAELFTERDLQQNADLSEAISITVEDGSDVTITQAGVYVISGSSSETTIVVETDDEAKVPLVLDGVSITNQDFPCIYVKNADKVFVTTAEGTVNSLSVTGTFSADGTTNTDAVIFSKDDLVLNGLGTLNIVSSDNGIACKDDLKVTGGTIRIECEDAALEANDSIAIAEGVISINTSNDGLHAENDDDDSVGYIYICGGTITIDAGDDGIHATTICQIDDGDITIDAAEATEATWIQINGGTLDLAATDDGINAGRKSNAYTVCIEINGGEISIDMGQGDTDAIDSNGNLYINGGTISINAQSPFDYDGIGQYNGGTIYVNGSQVDSLSNQMMGGPMGGFGQEGNGGFMDGGPGRHESMLFRKTDHGHETPRDEISLERRADSLPQEMSGRAHGRR